MSSRDTGRGPDIAASLRAHHLDDATDQATAQRDWVDIECWQIQPGRYRGRLAVLDLPAMRIVREHQEATVQKRGILPGGLCTVSVAEPTHPQARFSQFGGADIADAVFLLPGATEFCVSAPAGLTTTYVTCDQSALVSAAARLDPRWQDGPAGDVMMMPGGRHVGLGGLFDCLLALAEQAPVAGPAAPGATSPFDPARLGSLLSDTILRALAGGAITVDDTGARRSRWRMVGAVRQARDYVDETLAAGDIPTLSGLAGRLALPERTIQYYFREHLGLTPVAYLRILRLNQVRRALRTPSHPGLTVTEAAMHWGFLHLGKFAREYRALFGEPPSATLAEGRARAQW